MQEQRPQNGFNETSATNLVKSAIIMLAIFGLLDKFNIINLNKSRFNHIFAAVSASIFMAVMSKLLNEHVPETVPPHAGLLAKLGAFSQQVTAIRSPKTIAEGAAKGLLCGALLAMVLLKDKGPDFNLMIVMTFMGAAAGFHNTVGEFFRPGNR
ncbi:MAG TPA: hypothetical protein VGV92_02955 [Gammaproteobacteria bacterium]|nr:hypothetical protein [Gammaproteobacteria bacterium]